MAYTPNAVQGPASSTSGDLPSFSNTNGNVLQDSGVAAANVVTAAANGSGNLATITNAAKTISDSGVVAANVVTASANGSGNFATMTNSAKTISDSGTGLSTANTWTGVNTFNKAVIGPLTALSVSSNAVAVNLALANDFSLTLQATTGQTLSNPSNMVAGQSGVIVITQNGTPSTLAFGGYWVNSQAASAATVSTTASAVNILSYFVVDSTHIWYSLNTAGVA